MGLFPLTPILGECSTLLASRVSSPGRDNKLVFLKCQCTCKIWSHIIGRAEQTHPVISLEKFCEYIYAYIRHCRQITFFAKFRCYMHVLNIQLMTRYIVGLLRLLACCKYSSSITVYVQCGSQINCLLTQTRSITNYTLLLLCLTLLIVRSPPVCSHSL